jgi:type I restriction modification DNA specificity protein
MTRIDVLFDVSYGNKLDMNKMTRAAPAEGVAFIGRRGSGQGISGWVKPIPDLQPYPSGVITVALGGSRLLASFVQQRPFYTAQNVAVLEPRDPAMPLAQRLFYAMCIEHNRFRYTAFGREANRTLGSIDLPTKIPSWVGKTAVPTYEGLSKAAGPRKRLSNPETWPKFALGDLFEVTKGRRLTKAERVPGPTRFIGASEKNNGITDYTAAEPEFDGGCLTVAYNGSVGWTFYQDQPFLASDDVSVLRHQGDVSKWALLFVAAVIKHERARFSYGYKWTLERMRTTRIRLPATRAGKPDWRYMEALMRGLPFSAAVDGAD